MTFDPRQERNENKKVDLNAVERRSIDLRHRLIIRERHLSRRIEKRRINLEGFRMTFFYLFI